MLPWIGCAHTGRLCQRAQPHVCSSIPHSRPWLPVRQIQSLLGHSPLISSGFSLFRCGCPRSRSFVFSPRRLALVQCLCRTATMVQLLVCRLSASGSVDGNGVRLFVGDSVSVDTVRSEMEKQKPGAWGSSSNHGSGRLVYVPTAELDRLGALAKQRGLPLASALSLGYVGTPLESGRSLASSGIKSSGLLWRVVMAIFSPILHTDAPFMIVWEPQQAQSAEQQQQQQ